MMGGMIGGKKARWRLAAALPLLAGLAVACRSVPVRSTSTSGVGLDQGPTRWLMLPEEQRKYRRLRTTRETVDFIEDFWRRRDPDPNVPGNELSKIFYERVEAADRLYGEGGSRGSLTERGRALILLGPPPILRYSQKRVPAWDPGKPGAPSAVETRTLSLESWVYQAGELPTSLRSTSRKTTRARRSSSSSPSIPATPIWSRARSTWRWPRGLLARGGEPK